MGFAISILYLVTYYLTPDTVFGPLAAYHIELILAALVFVVSLRSLAGSYIRKTPQSLALIGLALATLLSVLIGMHWLGGAVQAFLLFIPNAFAYFLVCLHFNSKRKLKILIAMLLFVCVFVIAHGFVDLLHGVPEGAPLKSGTTESLYLMAQHSDSGDWIFRLTGLGEINDPNDFAQLLVCVLPLTFFYWREKKILQNIWFVILPACVLLFGAYLTHSRGAVLALIAMLLVAARRRIGLIPGIILAVGMFVAATALNFTGGREISASAGEDRTALWSDGLQMLKSHPLFGVGFGNFGDNSGLTAHNSVVVCAAELGLFGLYFWALFLFPTVRDSLVIGSTENVGAGEEIKAQESMFPTAERKIETVDKADINRMGRMLILSLTGFLVTGWFLSRAYVMTLFLLGGMVEVVYEMALQRGMVSRRLPLPRVLASAGGLALSLILLMYILLRTLNLIR
jgi:O-antigen ligase